MCNVPTKDVLVSNNTIRNLNTTGYNPTTMKVLYCMLSRCFYSYRLRRPCIRLGKGQQDNVLSFGEKKIKIRSKARIRFVAALPVAGGINEFCGFHRKDHGRRRVAAVILVAAAALAVV